MKNKKWKEIVAFSLPIIVLIGMTVSPILTVTTGSEIKLETKPVDPRDIFRGDYVTLSYQAEEVHVSKLEKGIIDYFNEQNVQDFRNEPLVVYSILKEKENNVYEVEEVVIEKPNSGLYLKGEINYLRIQPDDIHQKFKSIQEFNEMKANQTAIIHYNLDKFFIPENTGSELEDSINHSNSMDAKSKVFATIKVRNGNGILTNVKIVE